MNELVRLGREDNWDVLCCCREGVEREDSRWINGLISWLRDSDVYPHDRVNGWIECEPRLHGCRCET